MQFKKETIKNYRNFDLNILIERCQHYSLFDNNQIVGHLYCGLDNSVGLLNDTYLFIKRIKNIFTKRQFEFRNFNNNAVVGQLMISNFVAFKSLKISLDIIHKEPYKWKVVESFRSGLLFTSTNSKFLASLYNDEEDFIIKWNYKGDGFWKYRLEELPVEGEIQLKDSQNHFLLFAGLFLSEMELQLKSVD